MAVLSPTPRPSVATTIIVKPGVRRSALSAYRKSCTCSPLDVKLRAHSPAPFNITQTREPRRVDPLGQPYLELLHTNTT
jgi:hypothetical protein